MFVVYFCGCFFSGFDFIFSVIAVVRLCNSVSEITYLCVTWDAEVS